LKWGTFPKGFGDGGEKGLPKTKANSSQKDGKKGNKVVTEKQVTRRGTWNEKKTRGRVKNVTVAWDRTKDEKKNDQGDRWGKKWGGGSEGVFRVGWGRWKKKDISNQENEKNGAWGKRQNRGGGAGKSWGKKNGGGGNPHKCESRMR